MKTLPIPFTGKSLSIGLGERAHPAGDLLTRGGLSDLATGASASPGPYGDYYPKNVSVYSAIKLRADSIARAPVKVYQTGETADGITKELVASAHPVQSLLDLFRGRSGRQARDDLGQPRRLVRKAKRQPCFLRREKALE